MTAGPRRGRTSKDARARTPAATRGKCPTCGSTSVARQSVQQKAAKAVLFGVFATAAVAGRSDARRASTPGSAKTYPKDDEPRVLRVCQPLLDAQDKALTAFEAVRRPS